MDEATSDGEKIQQNFRQQPQKSRPYASRFSMLPGPVESFHCQVWNVGR